MRSSSFPSDSLWPRLPQAPSFSTSCCSCLSLGFPGLQESFPCSWLTGMLAKLLHALGASPSSPSTAISILHPASTCYSARSKFLQLIKILKKSCYTSKGWMYSHSSGVADGCLECLFILPQSEQHQEHSHTHVRKGANCSNEG